MHINDDLLESLRKDARSLVREFGFFQSRYAGTEATHGETHALIELKRLGDLEVGELARILNMDKTGASKLLNQLEGKKWVMFRKAADGRKKIYSLTPAGLKTCNQVEDSANLKVRAALAELKNEQRDTVNEGLHLLAEALKSSRARQEFQIRRCEPKDDKQICSIVKRSLKDLGFAGPGTAAGDQSLQFLSSFNGHRKCYLVAEKDGKILGGAGIAPLHGGNESTGELVRMFLHPEARSSGVAQLLMDEVLNRARAFGYKNVYLETTSAMKAAQKLYVKNGFAYLKKRRGNTGHFACDVVMERAL